MYEVVDDDYPNLEAFLCYRCGFQTNIVLMNEKGLYHEYQKLYLHATEILKPKKLPKIRKNQTTTEFQQRDKTPDDSTEPNVLSRHSFCHQVFNRTTDNPSSLIHSKN
jgi:hypothetical protein